MNIEDKQNALLLHWYGEPNAPSSEEVKLWLEQDPELQHFYESLATMDQLTDATPSSSPLPNFTQRAIQQIQEEESHNTLTFPWWKASIAAAFLLTAIIITLQYNQKEPNQHVNPTTTHQQAPEDASPRLAQTERSLRITKITSRWENKPGNKPILFGRLSSHNKF